MIFAFQLCYCFNVLSVASNLPKKCLAVGNKNEEYKSAKAKAKKTVNCDNDCTMKEVYY